MEVVTNLPLSQRLFELIQDERAMVLIPGWRKENQMGEGRRDNHIWSSKIRH